MRRCSSNVFVVPFHFHVNCFLFLHQCQFSYLLVLLKEIQCISANSFCFQLLSTLCFSLHTSKSATRWCGSNWGRLWCRCWSGLSFLLFNNRSGNRCRCWGGFCLLLFNNRSRNWCRCWGGLSLLLFNNRSWSRCGLLSLLGGSGCIFRYSLGER